MTGHYSVYNVLWSSPGWSCMWAVHLTNDQEIGNEEGRELHHNHGPCGKTHYIHNHRNLALKTFTFLSKQNRTSISSRSKQTSSYVPTHDLSHVSSIHLSFSSVSHCSTGSEEAPHLTLPVPMHSLPFCDETVLPKSLVPCYQSEPSSLSAPL